VVFFPKAKSICECGHSGDGSGSAHGDRILGLGHGRCLVPGCSCTQFTWKGFTLEFTRLLDKDRRESREL